MSSPRHIKGSIGHLLWRAKTISATIAGEKKKKKTTPVFVTLKPPTQLYRVWDPHGDHVAPYAFEQQKRPNFWFSDRQGIEQIRFPDAILKVYDIHPENPLKLIDLDSDATLKAIYTHTSASPDIKQVIRRLTGYQSTDLDNWLCGYKNKPIADKVWCSAPDNKEKPVYPLQDSILLDWVVKTYPSCHGYYHGKWKTFINGKQRHTFVEYGVKNPGPFLVEVDNNTQGKKK